MAFPLAPTTFKTSPNPNWTPRQRVEASPAGRRWVEDGAASGWRSFDARAGSGLGPLQAYHLMVSGVAPRPVAFVSSVSEAGIENLAPFSWFNQVSSRPIVISIGCTNVPPTEARPDGLKDTVHNIKATRGFTVNIMSNPWVEQANAACVDAPPEVSEWEVSGLTREKSVVVSAPRVKESAFSMECELLKIVDIFDPATPGGPPRTSLILATVVYIHVRADCYDETRGVMDPARFMPVARLGGDLYATLGGVYAIPRAKWGEGDWVEKEALDAERKEVVESCGPLVQ